MGELIKELIENNKLILVKTNKDFKVLVPISLDNFKKVSEIIGTQSQVIGITYEFEKNESGNQKAERRKGKLYSMSGV